ncbi:hypothetical protein OEZ86_001029 [Tetradesmus obliquus]|nr:hypothetical protein OEZ86_001029 [Tetradesmus obliquus]
MCPAGTRAYGAAGSTRCKPCRRYYQYSGPGASDCFTCSQNSRAKADNTGCECNPGCTADTGGSNLNPTCSCPGAVCQDPKEYTTITRADGTTHSGCYCKAGYVPDPNLMIGCAFSYLDAMGPGARCFGFAQPYIHPRDTACRSCQDMDVNAVSTVLGLTGVTDPGARTDNCIVDL